MIQDLGVVELVEQAKQEWEATVDSLPQLICLLDDRGRIIRANRIVEKWQLGSVTEVKGRTIHTLLHPGCSDPGCSLPSFWSRSWAELMEGQWVEAEMEDPRLGRYLNFQIHPISSQTQRKDKVTASFAALIIDDISKRKQVEAERENLIKELDAFAHTVAHDLQGSLAPVIGFADLLVRNHQTLPPERLQEFLEIIGQAGRKMSRIIKELLLLASARSKDVKLERLDMAAIVAEARQRLAPMIEEKQAEITLPGRWPAVWGYGPWIEEVWLNYLSNALKYGGQPPQVELGAAASPDGSVRFWVRDYGPGLQPEDQGRLFTPFTRLSRTHDGYGVGLSIVQRIVERLGGQVGVESSGIAGQGCTFFFTLPGAD